MSERVREFRRVLHSQLDEHEWSTAHLEFIPSLSEAVALIELDKGMEPITGGERGLKDDAGKDRWDLLLVMLGPQVQEVVRGLMYGAEKYHENPDDPNYRKMDDPRRRFGNAAMRHLISSMNGQETDVESGLPNLALAVVNTLFLRWHEAKRKE